MSSQSIDNSILILFIKFAHYHTLLSVDPELATLVKAVINNEARYVAEYPYCEAKWAYCYANTNLNM